MEIYESYMKFSFDDKDLFRIEKDDVILQTQGVKTCEFIVLISKNVALIEAKSSTPNPKNNEAFENFMTDIKQKFSDSLRLSNEIRNKEHGEDAYDRLPEHLQSVVISPNQYVIYLIVHGHKLEWIPGLQDSFYEAMRDVVNQWNMKDSSVKALNEEMAKELNLIVGYVPVSEIGKLKDTRNHPDEEKVKNWFEQN